MFVRSARRKPDSNGPIFFKQVGSAFSNLIYQDRQAVEREAAPRLTDKNGFVDFYCPGCNAVVRTYFRYVTA